MQYVGKRVSGRGNIKCKCPKVKTYLLPVQARRNGMARERSEKGGQGPNPGFLKSMLAQDVNRAYVISVGLNTPTTLPKHYALKVNHSGK